MAARRLIIIMLVLLGLSALLAVQLPQQTRETRSGTESTTTTESTASAPPEKANAVPPPPAADPVAAGKQPVDILCGEDQCATIEIDPKLTAVVPVTQGQQLTLLVKSPRKTDLVEIPALGLIDSVTPDKPAIFDLFADRAGDYGVRLVEGDRLIGRVEVRQRAREERAPGKSNDLP